MIPARVRRIVLAQQGGLCAGGCGTDLAAFARSTALHKYLPRGRYPVEFDHRVPQCDAVLVDGRPSVFRDGVWMPVHDARNLQAVCGHCHHVKTQRERPGWDAPSPSPFAHQIRSKPQAVYSGPVKLLRLRGKAPLKRCGAR